MKKIQRDRTAILLIFVISLILLHLCYIIYANSGTSSTSNGQIKDKKLTISNTKYILLFTFFEGTKNWKLNADTVGSEFFRSTQCPVTDCVVTSRPDLLPSIDSFDALVFHGTDPWSRPISIDRSPSQFYVVVMFESPVLTDHDLAKDGDFFNWTMTYRLDSDVKWTYGQLTEVNGARRVVAPSERALWLKHGFRNYSNQTLLGLAKKKSKMAAQFVSHCGAISGRDKLVRQIQKYIGVDVYGKCGTMECPRDSPRCTRMLNDDYRFYFAFENALCRDYVTEKLYNALEQHVIPVVFGGADYSKFVPPHSVINVQDFRTVKELADYLKFLADNPEEYVKYFWWKEHYRVTRQTFCDLCRKLHGIGAQKKPQYYEDIRAWWHDSACQNTRMKF